MAHRTLKSLIVGVALAVLATPAAVAGPFVFSGGDPGAGPLAPTPNSDAAAAAFDAATPGLGLLTFTGLPAGLVIDNSFLPLGGGAFLAQFGPGQASIEGPLGNVITGYNTTSPLSLGNRFVQFSPLGGPVFAPMTFLFSTPVNAFGAYFTGVGTASGTLHLRYFDFAGGGFQNLVIPGDPLGGALFFGFVDPGASIFGVQLQLEGASIGDIYGVDDVRYGTVIPEPSTMALVALGLLGLRRRQQRRG